MTSPPCRCLAPVSLDLSSRRLWVCPARWTCFLWQPGTLCPTIWTGFLLWYLISRKLQMGETWAFSLYQSKWCVPSLYRPESAECSCSCQWRRACSALQHRKLPWTSTQRYVQRLHFYIVYVHIQDLPEAIKVCVSAEWLAHENAVFDIAWVPREAQLVSMTYYLIPLYW